MRTFLTPLAVLSPIASAIAPLERKGFVTEADLEAYARSIGLPTSYAKNFVSAIVGSSGQGGREVGFKAFSAFVRTRETALRAAFHHFGESRGE